MLLNCLKKKEWIKRKDKDLGIMHIIQNKQEKNDRKKHYF